MSAGTCWRPWTKGASGAERDLLVRGGDVIDGTGAPARRADVRVHDGVIVEIGPDLAHEGEMLIDASGAVVTPASSTPTPTPIPRSSEPLRYPEPRYAGSPRCSADSTACRFPASQATRPAVRDVLVDIDDVARHQLVDAVPPRRWYEVADCHAVVTTAAAGIHAPPGGDTTITG